MGNKKKKSSAQRNNSKERIKNQSETVLTPEMAIDSSDNEHDVFDHPPSLFQQVMSKEKILGLRPTSALLVLMVLIALGISTLTSRNNGTTANDDSSMVNETADSAMMESAQIGNMEFTVLDYSFTDLLPDETVPTLHDGNTMCSVKITAKNVSKESTTLTSPSVWASAASRFTFRLIYADGYMYNTFLNPDTTGLLLNYKDAIIPLQTISGYVYFEVPQEVAQETRPLGIAISQNAESNTWLLCNPT